MDLGRMEAGTKSDFLCCMTHQNWVRGIRPRSTPGDHRQLLLVVGLLFSSQLPQWSSSWVLSWAAWAPGFLSQSPTPHASLWGEWGFLQA